MIQHVVGWHRHFGVSSKQCLSKPRDILAFYTPRHLIFLMEAYQNFPLWGVGLNKTWRCTVMIMVTFNVILIVAIFTALRRLRHLEACLEAYVSCRI